MKKIKLLALMLALVAALCIAFVVSASAEEEQIVVTYNNFSGSVWKTAIPNADGSYTLFTTKKSGNGTATLANGTKVDKEFYGWFTKDGTLYAPGETVTFTKSTQLYEAYGVTVSNAEDLDAVSGDSQVTMFVKLANDITSTTKIGASWATTIVDLNGHNLTVTNNNSAFYGYRGACVIIGKGKVTHAPVTLNKDDKAGFFFHDLHTYGYDSNPQLCWVGKDVEIETPYNLVYVSAGENSANVPNIDIYGTVTAKTIVRGAIFNNAKCNIHSTAKLTLTGTNIFNFTKETGTNIYMYLSLDGEITVTDPEAVFLSDFILSSSLNITPITGGKFTISSADAEKLKSLIAETHMLKATENQDGTTTYNVVLTDCVHNWVVNEDATVEPTLDQLGIDAKICTKCGNKKQTVVAYAPYDVEISVTVNENGEEKTYTMLAGDVFSFSVTEKNGSKQVSKITDVIYRKNDIVKLEIPYGVELISIYSMSSLKELSFMDNSCVDFKKNAVTNCPSLETIIIGKRDVTFMAGTNENTEAGVFTSCPNLTTLDVSEANATFNKYAFANNKTIKHLLLGEGNTYVFNEDSFRHSSLTEVIIPDNTPTTLGKKCFAETTTIEYLYIGANSIASKSIGDDSNVTSVFGGNSVLAKVVLMDIDYIGKWSLSTKKPGNAYEPLCDMYVYAHSESFSFHAEAFNDRAGNYITYIYSANPDITSVTSSSNYVIFKGIGHKYTESVIYESTCAAPGKGGYVTDCPCNIDYRENSYKTVSNKIDSYKDKTFAACGSAEYDLPLKTEHTLSDVIKSVIFENGFINLGTKSYKCLYCNEIAGVEEEPSFPALFSFNGYSTPEDGDLAISVGYSVFKDAISEYEAIMGNLEFGVVGAIYEKLGGLAPLAQSAAPVIKAQITEEYSSFDFVISGFTVEQMDLALVMCAYVYDGTKYVYLQEAQTENPTAVSINTILMQNA